MDSLSKVGIFNHCIRPESLKYGFLLDHLPLMLQQHKQQ